MSSLRERLRYHARRLLTDPLLFAARRVRNRTREFEPVFVVGVMGSGTSLLAMELWRRFDFAGISNESALEVRSSSVLNVDPVGAFASIHAYEQALEPDPTWSSQRARADLQDLYRSRASAAGSRVVDKGPNANLVRAGYLAELFPEARFVMIYRDPAANIEGLRRKWPTFGRESLEASIGFYQRVYERFLRDSEGFAERCTIVSYPGLVESNDATLDALADRLDLGRLERNRRVPRARDQQPGQGIRSVRDGELSIVRGADASAVARLPADEVSRIRGALDDLHERMRSRAINEPG